MKNKQLKLRWKIFAYILIFAAIVVAIFCFFQIFMLEYFYKRTKTSSTDACMDEVSQIIEDKQNISAGDEDLINLSKNAETDIYLFKIDDGSLSFAFGNGNYFMRFDKQTIDDVVQKARSLGKSKFYITFSQPDITPFGPGVMVTNKYVNNRDSAIICGKIINYQGNASLLILDARLAPVDPAVKTLKQQLLYISLIVIVVAIVVAFVISQTISKPINDMTLSAEKLARGNRDIHFDGKGFYEIQELNKSLNYAVEELNKSDTLQKELLANISHDLKTPLTVISGYAEMMKDMPEEVTEENLNLIIEEATRLNVLVNDLLNLSRLQAGTIEFDMQKFDCALSLKDLAARQSALRAKDGISVIYEGLDSIMIVGDKLKLEQVFYNFINNAINYSKDDKSIIIRTSVSENEAKFEFIDHGIGIKEEDLDLIWNRYFRVDKSLQRSEHGSGLGLAISKEILSHHGFKFGVDSTYGKGSTFYFYAPIAEDK